MTTPTTKAAELPEALPRYREYMHLRTTGAWSSGVPAWARDYSGLMNDMTAAHAVIEELYAKVEALQGFAAPQPAVAAGWMPIETAPKHESVLLYSGGFTPIYCGRRRYGLLGEPQQDVLAWRCDSSGRFANPTRWLPLPPAPSTEGESNV